MVAYYWPRIHTARIALRRIIQPSVSKLNPHQQALERSLVRDNINTMLLTDIPLILASFTIPLCVLALSQLFLLLTAIRLLVTFDLQTLFSPRKLQAAAFNKFWIAYGPVTSAADEDYVKPIVARASGRVLDIGPGAGLELQSFDQTKVCNKRFFFFFTKHFDSND